MPPCIPIMQRGRQVANSPSKITNIYAEKKYAGERGNPAITITMQPPNFTTGLGLVTDDSIVAVLASIKSSNRGPSIGELDSIKLPDYGLTEGQSEPPITSAKDSSTLHQSTPVADSQTTPSDLEASPPQSPTFEGDTATSIVPSFWYPAMNR